MEMMMMKKKISKFSPVAPPRRRQMKFVSYQFRVDLDRPVHGQDGQQGGLVQAVLQPQLADHLRRLESRLDRSRDGHDEEVKDAVKVLEDELAARLADPLAQIGLVLLRKADQGQLLADEEPVDL